jgi:ferric-dicitrate binding protein FerR (iron transport regulator)
MFRGRILYFYIITIKDFMEKNYDELIIGYFSGELADAERKELAHALETSPECRALYDELVKLYGQSRIPRFEAQKESNYNSLRERLFESPREPGEEKKSLAASLRRIAAVIVITLLSGTLAYYIYEDNSRSGLAANEITTPLGSQTRITLPDGSVVWLNSGSILSYGDDFGLLQREVSLVGEGYFEVKKAEGKKFVVRAENLNIEVLGTKFNVENYPENHIIDVSVIEGAVKVHSADRLDVFTLRPDQSLACNKGNYRMEVSAVDARKTAMWAEGKLSFVNTPLSDIMKDIERAYNVRIEMRTDKIYRERFSGSIGLNMTIDDILRYVDVDNKYIWTLESNVLTIKDR